MRRADLTAKLQDRNRFLEALKSAWWWKLIKPLWRDLGGETADAVATAAGGGRLAWAMDEPKSWEVQNEEVLLRGWCFAQEGDAISGLRAKVNGKTFYARYGLPRPDVTENLGAPERDPACGYEIAARLPLGTSIVLLEAISQGGDWERILQVEANRTS